MNLKNVMAALLVATASMMAVPMATASHETCPSNPTTLSPPMVSAQDGQAAPSAPANYRIDLTSVGISREVIVIEKASSDDVIVTVWEKDGSGCHLTALDYNDEPVTDGVGSTFVLAPLKEYFVIIEDEGTASDNEEFTIQVV